MSLNFNTYFDFNSRELVDYFDDLPFWAAPFGIRLLENVKIKKNITALDIGFGTGFPLTELAMRLGNSSKVYGLDPWDAAIDRAKRKIEYYGISNINIIKGVAENIPLNDNYIDLIVSNNGINNVSNLEKVLSECSRVVKAGGQFIQTMNTEGTMMEFYKILSDIFERRGMFIEKAAVQKHIYEKRKPMDELCALLEKNSLKIQNIIEDQFDYRFADASAMFDYFFFRLAFIDSWIKLIPESLRADIFSEIKIQIDRVVGDQGCFKLTIPFVVIDSLKA